MKVSVVIPAYNEEKYIQGVLEPLKNVEEIGQVIVVSDGSVDRTAEIAERWGAEVIRLEENTGKGGAIAVGIKAAQEEVILFLDADLIGLTEQHVRNLIQPVLMEKVDMTVGVFESGRKVTDLAQHLAPHLSGQRCLKKKWLYQVHDLSHTGFGVEVVLTNFAHQHHLRLEEIHLPAMSHVMKEEKLGIRQGIKFRLKMYWEIAKNMFG